MNHLVCLGLLYTCTLLISCKEKKKNEIQPESVLEVKLFKNLKADVEGKNRYTFFSVKNNDTISRADSATTKWDIAFKGTSIIVNGGTSGPGSTSVKIFTGTFEELIEAPSEGYKTDGISPAIPTGSGNGWYNYSGAPTHIITPIPGRILVIKTSEGKFTKLEILSYYKDLPTAPVNTDPARYYSFRFVYQPGTSNSLQ